MFKLPIEVALERHTDEVKERAYGAMEMFELFIGELSDRERQIFEVAYCNGYSDSNDENERGDQVEVLK